MDKSIREFFFESRNVFVSRNLFGPRILFFLCREFFSNSHDRIGELSDALASGESSNNRSSSMEASNGVEWEVVVSKKRY